MCLGTTEHPEMSVMPTWTETQIDAEYRGPSCDFRVRCPLPRDLVAVASGAAFQGWGNDGHHLYSTTAHATVFPLLSPSAV